MLVRIWGTSADFAQMARLFINEQSFKISFSSEGVLKGDLSDACRKKGIIKESYLEIKSWN